MSGVRTGLAGLDEQVVVVTGGAGGLGSATARRLSAEGASVVVVDLDAERAEAVAAELSGEAIGVGADVAAELDVQGYVEAAVDRFGRIDGAFFGAGYPGRITNLDEGEIADFDKTIGVNLRGTYLGMRAVITRMKAQGGGGSIVATGSGLAKRGGQMFGPYAAAKHGVIGLVRSVALEVARAGIRVNAVCPGFMETNMMKPTEAFLNPDDPAAAHALLESSIPLGHYAQPEEVAAAVCWFLSSESRYATGAALDVDGGVIASAGGFMEPVESAD
jgi:NAD(P)-dependent dehydrogenase (short-subunit alcohol dehydrogenase family)